MVVHFNHLNNKISHTICSRIKYISRRGAKTKRTSIREAMLSGLPNYIGEQAYTETKYKYLHQSRLSLSFMKAAWKTVGRAEGLTNPAFIRLRSLLRNGLHTRQYLYGWNANCACSEKHLRACFSEHAQFVFLSGRGKIVLINVEQLQCSFI